MKKYECTGLTETFCLNVCVGYDLVGLAKHVSAGKILCCMIQPYSWAITRNLQTKQKLLELSFAFENVEKLCKRQLICIHGWCLVSHTVRQVDLSLVSGLGDCFTNPVHTRFWYIRILSWLCLWPKTFVKQCIAYTQMMLTETIWFYRFLCSWVWCRIPSFDRESRGVRRGWPPTEWFHRLKPHGWLKSWH